MIFYFDSVIKKLILCSFISRIFVIESLVHFAHLLLIEAAFLLKQLVKFVLLSLLNGICSLLMLSYSLLDNSQFPIYHIPVILKNLESISNLIINKILILL